MTVEHHLLAANQENEILNPLHRNQLCALIIVIWLSVNLRCQFGTSSFNRSLHVQPAQAAEFFNGLRLDMVLASSAASLPMA